MQTNTQQKSVNLFVLIIIFLLLDGYQAFSQGVSVNTTGASPDPSAGLDVNFNDRGFLMPRLSMAERNAVSSPAEGLFIFNTTTKCFEAYVNSAWNTVSCPAACIAPSSPVAGTITPDQTQIVWSWNQVSSATGYKYNTVNDLTTATDNGTNLSYTQTGLTCNTSYNLYVWAYNVCGNSNPVSLTQVTSSCFNCGVDNVSFTYHSSSVTYGTVAGQNATCWLDRNLGASQVATAYNDGLAYGDLFQWGRLDDGHQLRSSSVTSLLSNNDVPGHSNYITISSSTYDWRSTQNDNLWQGSSGVNNPCPTGWRLPTEVEINNERLSWLTNNSNGAFSSPLKLTVTGFRHANGTLYPISSGEYWACTVDGTNSRNLDFSGGDAFMDSSPRAFGRSVRCIKD